LNDEKPLHHIRPKTDCSRPVVHATFWNASAVCIILVDYHQPRATMRISFVAINTRYALPGLFLRKLSMGKALCFLD
jgi:hypothetical protein